MNNKGFTLIEILVVIAILATLAVAVTLIINPAELVRQARDSTRLSDMNQLNKALGLYDSDQYDQSMGGSETVYISLPDSNSDCSSYSLPDLPSGWSYNCVPEDDLTKVDGNGWVPVDFTSMTFQSPLSNLPVDPVNSIDSNLFYTYVPGSWELTAELEANTYRVGGDDDKMSNDGGDHSGTYEIGSDLELTPSNLQGKTTTYEELTDYDNSLVSYWPLDDGSGSTATDEAGSNDGSLSGDPGWISGQVGDALSFDGDDDFVSASFVSAPDLSKQTILFWYKNQGAVIDSSGNQAFELGGDGSSEIAYVIEEGGGADHKVSASISHSGWNMITGTYDGSTMILYFNGEKKAEKSVSDIPLADSGVEARINHTPGSIIDLDVCGAHNCYANGQTDEVYIYNRVLSESEINTIYNEGK